MSAPRDLAGCANRVCLRCQGRAASLPPTLPHTASAPPRLQGTGGESCWVTGAGIGNASPLPESRLTSIPSAVLAWPGCVRGEGAEAGAGHWRQSCLWVSRFRESSRSRSLEKSRVQLRLYCGTSHTLYVTHVTRHGVDRQFPLLPRPRVT